MSRRDRSDEKLFNHTKRPDRNWEEDVQDGYDWDEEEYTGEDDGEEYYADEEEYTGEEDGEEYYADDVEYIEESDDEEYYADEDYEEEPAPTGRRKTGGKSRAESL